MRSKKPHLEANCCYRCIHAEHGDWGDPLYCEKKKVNVYKFYDCKDFEYDNWEEKSSAKVLTALDRIDQYLLNCDTELIGVKIDEIRQELSKR